MERKPEVIRLFGGNIDSLKTGAEWLLEAQSHEAANTTLLAGLTMTAEYQQSSQRCE